MEKDTRLPTFDQLRAETDRGQAADKAPGVDPAAAPLGTDAEAGGNPPTPEQLAMEDQARSHEDPKRPTGGAEAAESVRGAEDDGPAGQRMEADRPSEGGSAAESLRAGEDRQRGGRAAEVIPSREDETPGALSDDPSPPSRPSAAP